MPDGTYTVQASQSDEAGNTGFSPAVTFTVDTHVPATPTVSSPAAPLVTNALTVNISGTAEANDLVWVVPSGGPEDLPAVLDGSEQLSGGNTHYFITVALTANEANSFQVVAHDAAGTGSEWATVPTITQDSIPPAAPTITEPAAGGVITAAATYTIQGTAEANSLVKVYTNSGGTLVASEQLSGGGTSFALAVLLASGADNYFTVTATDAAGNQSTAATVPTIDQGTPVTTPVFTLGSPSGGTYYAGQSVTVQWTAALPAGDSGTINLAYAPNAIPWSANSQWMFNVATAADGAGSFAWNTAGVAAGTYYLTGYLWDITSGEPVFNEIATPIVIQPGNSFAISAPSPLTYIAGQNVTIQWTENIIPGDSGSINLAYAPNATAWSPNATWIYNVATAADGTGSYAWNTTGVAGGTYYLNGYLWDATAGQPFYNELYTTPIVIQSGDSFALSTPSPLTYIAGQNVTIQWTGSIIAGHSGSINLAYAPNATAWSPNATWIYNVATAANGAGSYLWDTAGVAGGTYYLSGYFWDATAGQPFYSEIYTTPIVIYPGDSFALSTPSPLTYPAGQNVTIQWTGYLVPGDSGSINLAYAPNATAWSPNATWLYSVATAATGPGSYAWNTAGVAAGTYYLSGYFWDATMGEPRYSELYTTPIVIQPGASQASAIPTSFALSAPAR